MSVVWKFPVPVEGEFAIEMPLDAVLRCVQTQHGEPFLWAEVNPNRDPEPRKFRLIGTGHPIKVGSELLEYVGTFQLWGGDLVWHLYEVDDMEYLPF